MKSMKMKKIQGYGLYNAHFTRVPTPGLMVRQENWTGKMPSNKSSGGATKFKKTGGY